MVSEDLSTRRTFCRRSSSTRLSLCGRHLCCLLRKTVPHVPHRFPISLVFHQNSLSSRSWSYFQRVSTNSCSSPLSCIRFNANQSTWIQDTHKCACSLMSTAGQIHYILKNRFISNHFTCMLVKLVPQLRSPKLFSQCEISCKV